MSTMNFKAAAAAALGNNDTPAASDEYVKAQVWLNVGVTLPVVNAEGKTEEVFTSIPSGVPLDTMEAMTARGNNVVNNQKVEAGNHVMHMLQELAENLAPGETQIVDLQVEMRRVNTQGTAGTAAAGAENAALEAAKTIKLVK